MDLYKKEGVNPVGGCLPMLLQLPFFYAFYRVLNIAIELRHAPWLWVPDLSSAETLPIHLLPIILIATQFFSQKLTPAAGVDPNQQKMMMFMPLMFGLHVLLRLSRTCTILVDRKRGGNRSTAHHQSVHATRPLRRLRRQSAGEEPSKNKRMKYTVDSLAAQAGPVSEAAVAACRF